MLTLTVRELNECFQIFAQLAATKATSGHQQFFWNLSRTWKELKKESKTIIEKTREIYLSFGATEKDGTLEIPPGSLDDDRKKEFNAALEELNEVTVDVWGHTVTIERLEAAGIMLSMDEMNALCWLIDSGVDEPQPTKKSKKANA